jgi:uncharacterized repeat protein (TIGR01451 family)
MNKRRLPGLLVLIVMLATLAPMTRAEAPRRFAERPTKDPIQQLPMRHRQGPELVLPSTTGRRGLEPFLNRDPTEPEGSSWDDLPPEIQAKVDPRILAELHGEAVPAHLSSSPEYAHFAPAPLDKTRFIVYLKAKADLASVSGQVYATKAERREAVVDTLVSTAQATQRPVRVLLETRMAQGEVSSFQSFYIVNGFAVEGNLDAVIELAQRDDVERIAANYALVPLWKDSDAKAPSVPIDGDPSYSNWNIVRVDADRVWDELGITGEGAVVGGFDTGVDWTHIALQSRYRGYDPVGTVHDYSWFEADSKLYPNGDLGPSVSTAPYDCQGHGTHTMGTMVGDGGTSDTQIGMAPGARWIAAPGICGNTMPGGLADDIGGLKTFQWFLCPTDLTGQLSTADCSKAPDAINNSWGSSNPADDTFYPIIQILRAAGIAPVFASGNPMAGDGSIGSPGSAPEAITVGATDRADNIADFSGRGPSFFEGEQKPELSAPGIDVLSSYPGNYYGTSSGTSMAAPHVAGLIALMVSADLADGYRDLNVDELERFIAYTAVDLGAPGHDDDYGHGRIDAYNAVRWALSAGDLRGTVTDLDTGHPIPHAAVTGVEQSIGDAFATQTDASGQYSTTVPAGTYAITAQAWGYDSATFANQVVIAGALSFADLALTPVPTATLTGQVVSGTAPISGAQIHVADAPWMACTAGTSGAYTLSMPVGTQALVVRATGYRTLREDVSIAPGGTSHDLAMTPAPTILLVEADAFYGWFYGRPVHRFFEWALDQEDYLYDLWKIQYTGFTDTQELDDGSLGYGIPSTSTLGTYDVIVWAHTATSPRMIGADDELMSYLDDGGKLIISGQDIGYWDDRTAFYADYLGANYTMDYAAYEGETVSGSEFLAGVVLTVTDGALHDYPNTALYSSPDAVSPADSLAFPVLTYDNGSGAAALATASCDPAYRVVYLAIGYENIGPRAANRDPAIARVLGDSIQWTTGARTDYDLTLSLMPTSQARSPGATVTYDVRVLNLGAQADTYTVDLTGNTWLTQIYSGTAPLLAPLTIPPCGAQELTIKVDIPPTAEIGDRDTVTVTVAGTASASGSATTLAFPQWQIEAPMPTARYRLATVSLPGDSHYYAIGGLGASSYYAIGQVERYDVCANRWEQMTPMPTPRGNIGAVAIGGEIYVPGGYRLGQDYQDTLEIYDPATDSWTSGAPLPQSLSGAATAGYGGKLYVFGGSTAYGEIDKTYEYNPATDTWTEKAPMPGGPRAYAAAAELNGRIYVVGGWLNLNTVEVYNPATDSWSSAAPMNVGRQSPGLAAAPDGYLYVSGGGYGWMGLNSTERYNPTSDSWEPLPSLKDSDRAGSGLAFAGGHLFAVGGSGLSYSAANESLGLVDSFCFSSKSTRQGATQPGTRITYTIEILSELGELTGVSVLDPIPAGVTFAGFGVNSIGAVYNGGANRVEWHGTIPAQSAPLTFTFGVDVPEAGWAAGDLITNVATFDSGAGRVFGRTVVSVVGYANPGPSVKSADKDAAAQGDVLTYTIRVENASAAADTFYVRDPIPAQVTYLPGSVTCTLGSAGYDAANGVITWTGVLPIEGAYVNSSSDYVWGDSNGEGDVPGVRYEWIDISGTGTPLNLGSSSGIAIPIGFDFEFYGSIYPDVGVSSEGYLTFEPNWDPYPDLADGGEDCPIVWNYDPNDTVAPFWDSQSPAVAGGNVYYQLFGSAPARYLVVQWQDNYIWGTDATATYQAILYERENTIRFQYETLTTSNSYVVGIENRDATDGITYNTCGHAGVVYDGLAILFLPPDGMFGQSSADIVYSVAVDTPLPPFTWITNTATITTTYSYTERSASTLINTVNLDTSTKGVDRAQAHIGDVLTYELVLENTGTLTAANAALTDAIPANTAFVPGSLTCGSGTCAYHAAEDTITWSGGISPGDAVTVGFAVTLTTITVDMMPVTNTATLDDGHGHLYDLEAVSYARRSDLRSSFKQASPRFADPGEFIAYTIYVWNTGSTATVGWVEDRLPPELTYEAGSLVCGTGSCGYAAGVITWTGTVQPRGMVPIQFGATASSALSLGDVFTNTAVITDVVWNTVHEAAAPVKIGECIAVTGVDLVLGTTGAIYTSTLVSLSVDIAPEDADGPYSFIIDYDDGTIPFSGSSSLDPLELTHVFATAGTHRVEISVWNCETVPPETDTVYVPVRGARNEIYLPLISKD